MIVGLTLAVAELRAIKLGYASSAAVRDRWRTVLMIARVVLQKRIYVIPQTVLARGVPTFWIGS